MKEPLRAAIEGAANERGISLNAEAVRRLEASFAREEAADAAFGGRAQRVLMQFLAHAISLVEEQTDGKWLENPTTHGAVRGMLDSVLDELAPKERISGELELTRMLGGPVATKIKPVTTVVKKVLMEMRQQAKPKK